MYSLSEEEMVRAVGHQEIREEHYTIAREQLKKVHDEIVLEIVSGSSYGPMMFDNKEAEWWKGQIYRNECIRDELRKELGVEGEAERFMFRPWIC